MDPLAAGPPAFARTLRFGDVDAFAQALRGGGVEYLPLRSGPMERRLTQLGMASMGVQRALDGGHVSRGVVDPNQGSLLFAMSRLEPPARVNGWTTDCGSTMLLAPGAELHAHCPGVQDWAAWTLPADDMAALADLPGLPEGPGARPRNRLLRNLPGSVIRATAAATELAGRDPAALAAPGFGQALEQSLRDLLATAFVALGAEPPPTRATLRALRLVAMADDFLRANIARPVYSGELCQALGISARGLHQAFAAACGMSPQAYLKRRRLMMAHRALRDPEGATPLVKSVALSHGFWHLGNFAHDYRRMFGRMPSETLAAARGAPAPAGRALMPAG